MLCQTEATRWTDAWTTFANVEKTWAYRQDQLPSTHPIATDAPDVQTAEVNFDGITYAKGASVLKQLGAYVGVEAFLAGLRDYFAEHAFGNTTLADLLAALEKPSGRDLGEWSQALARDGRHQHAASGVRRVDAEGAYTLLRASCRRRRTTSRTSNTLRPHRLAIGCYDERGRHARPHRAGRARRRPASAPPCPSWSASRSPTLLLVNDDDLTYCKLRLDEQQPARRCAPAGSRSWPTRCRARCAGRRRGT